jgi:hypothetical protein
MKRQALSNMAVTALALLACARPRTAPAPAQPALAGCTRNPELVARGVRELRGFLGDTATVHVRPALSIGPTDTLVPLGSPSACEEPRQALIDAGAIPAGSEIVLYRYGTGYVWYQPGVPAGAYTVVLTDSSFRRVLHGGGIVNQEY